MCEPSNSSDQPVAPLPLKSEPERDDQTSRLKEACNIARKDVLDHQRDDHRSCIGCVATIMFLSAITALVLIAFVMSVISVGHLASAKRVTSVDIKELASITAGLNTTVTKDRSVFADMQRRMETQEYLTKILAEELCNQCLTLSKLSDSFAGSRKWTDACDTVCFYEWN